MRVARCVASLVGAALVLGGCSDEAAPIAPILEQDRPDVTADDHLEPQARDRFHLNVSVAGSLKPGEPFQVRAWVRGLLSTAEVDFRIVLPEVEFARQTNWRVDRSPVGLTIGSVSEQRAPLPAGAELEANARITIPAAGVYRVLAIVVKRSSEPDFEGSVAIHHTQFKEVWVRVSERGGGVTLTQEAVTFEKQFVPSPGPFRLTAAHKAPGATPRDDPSAQAVDNAQFQFVYYHSELGVYRPVAGAWFYFEEYDAIDGTLLGTWSAIADANGLVPAPCYSYPNTRVESYLDLGNPDVFIQNGRYSYGGRDCSVALETIILPSDPSHVYVNMTRIIPASRAFFSASRGRVSVALLNTIPVSRYFPSPERIEIATAGNNRAVFNSPYGAFTQAHEYGHAMHYGGLGGYDHNGGPCPDPHYIYGPGTLGCAFREGFADYHAVVTFGADVGYFLPNIESNAYYSSGDGSIIEGPVASMLYDLTDPANEAFDAVHFPGSYVGGTIRSCRLFGGYPSTYRPNGSDHLVYCFERVVDAGTKSYFPTRSSVFRPTQVTSNVAAPAGWSLGAVRAIWRRNLRGL